MKSAIGVFDSGVGGLTVLKSLREAFPHQEFIYLGDTARLPYGAKSADTILQYTKQNLKFLAKRDVQAVVIACNSASSQYLDSEFEGIPVYNVIDPGVQSALAATQNSRIGLIGTRATVQSQAYQNRLQTEAKKIGKKIEVFSAACPLLVPLAEEGWVLDPITNLITYRYLHPLLLEEIDTLILGCTHYPILKPSISKAAGSLVQLIDSGEALIKILNADFEKGRIKRSSQAKLEILMTDLSAHLQNWSKVILQDHDFEIEVVNTLD